VFIANEIFDIWLDRRSGRIRPRADLAVLAMFFVLIIVIIPNAMWLPSEAIELSDSTSVVGYVLTDNDGRALVLKERDRSLIELRTTDIKSRQPCRLHGSSLPVISYLFGGPIPSIPRCP
jgi:hypothetical protein